jgi:hypothetical protein
MQKFTFNEIQEGKTYILFDKQTETARRMVCVYDHTVRLMAPNTEHRPLKYLIDAFSPGKMSPRTIEKHMALAKDDVLWSDETKHIINNMVSLWEHDMEKGGNKLMFATV